MVGLASLDPPYIPQEKLLMFRLKMSHGANISPYCPASRWSALVIGNLSLNN